MSCFSCFKKTNQVYPIVVINDGVDFKNQECMICLTKTEKNSVLLPCGHCYHYDCIFKWFEKEMSCPTCKQVFRWKKIYCKNANLTPR